MGDGTPAARGGVAKGTRGRALTPSSRKKPARKSMTMRPEQAGSSAITPEKRHEMVINTEHLHGPPPKGKKHIYEGVTIRHSDGSIGFIYPESRIPGVYYFWAAKGSSVALPMVDQGTRLGFLLGGHVSESAGIPVDQLPKVRRICHWAQTEHLHPDSNSPGQPYPHGFDHAVPRETVDLPYFYNSRGSPATMGMSYGSGFNPHAIPSEWTAEPAVNVGTMLPTIANPGGASGTASTSPSLDRGHEEVIRSNCATARIMHSQGLPNNVFNAHEVYPAHGNISNAQEYLFESTLGQNANVNIEEGDGARPGRATGTSSMYRS